MLIAIVAGGNVLLEGVPGGQQVVQTRNFEQTRYYYTFDTPNVGKYEVQITYTFGENTYVSNTVFCLARSPEYAAFAMSSAAAGCLNRYTWQLLLPGDLPVSR